ncbi:MAG: polysaccharide biosynthesis/export family protein [Bacteroidota bacterium]
MLSFFFRNNIFHCIKLFLLISLSSACTSLKQNILFKTENTLNGDVFKHSFEKVTANYKIQVNDRLAISVFTNKGERLIDPNREFNIGDAPAEQRANAMGNQGFMQQENTNAINNLSISQNSMPPISYLIKQNGKVNLPMLGDVSLKGLTLAEAEKHLAEKYAKYYENPFIITQYINKRVVLMGALGDQVIPLRNENMTVLEVLALAGDVQSRSKPDNIRLIRGPWGQPSIKLIDLTDISQIKDANIIVEPNDIIYVEPRRRIDRESIQDFNVVFAPLTTLITLSLTVLLFIRETN